MDRATWGIDRGLGGRDRVLQVGIRACLILFRTALKDAEFQTEIISENYDDYETFVEVSQERVEVRGIMLVNRKFQDEPA